MLLECYQAIEAASARMLQAARVHDWDSMVACERDCALLIDALRLRAATDTLDARTRAEKTRIMLRILDNDAQIRNLTEPVLDACALHLQGSKFLH